MKPFFSWKTYQRILRLAFPVMLSFFAFHLLGITDVIMVGRLGPQALAAVGLANTLLYLVIAPLEGILGAALIVFPGLLAKRCHGEMKMATKALTIASVFVGILLLLVYSILSWYLGKLSTDTAVLYMAREYLWIRLLGGTFLMVSLLWSRILLAMEKNFSLAIFSYLVVFVNIFGNWLLIFGPGPFPALGTHGAAWASTIAQFVNMVLLLIGGQHAMVSWEKAIPFSWRFIKNFAKIGWPMGTTYLIEILAWTIFVSLIAQLGTNAVAIHEIALKIKDLSLLLGIAIANVTTQQVSFVIGKEQPKKAIQIVRGAVHMNVLVMGVVGILYWFFPEALIGLVTKDKKLIHDSASLLRFMALYQIADAIFITYRASLEGLGKTALIRNISLLTNYLVWLPLSWMGVSLLKGGVVGGWAGLTITVAFLAIIFWKMFSKEVWRTQPLPTPPISTASEELK